MISLNSGITIVLVLNIIKVILIPESFNNYRFILLSSVSETIAGISPTPALLDGHSVYTNTSRDRLTLSQDSPFLFSQKDKNADS